MAASRWPSSPGGLLETRIEYDPHAGAAPDVSGSPGGGRGRPQAVLNKQTLTPCRLALRRLAKSRTAPTSVQSRRSVRSRFVFARIQSDRSAP